MTAKEARLASDIAKKKREDALIESILCYIDTLIAKSIASGNYSVILDHEDEYFPYPILPRSSVNKLLDHYVSLGYTASYEDCIMAISWE